VVTQWEVLSVSMDSETNKRPLIQIDSLVRSMTDEEYAEWLARPIVELFGE
jgi:hypothetical protein